MSEMNFPPTLALRCGPVTAVDLALFAAASGDHNPLHLDVDVARTAGFDRPVVHGMFTMACAARLFTRAFGAGSVRALQTRFTGVALLGDTLLFEAARIDVPDASLHDGITRDALGASYTLTARTESGTALVSGTVRVGRVAPPP